jgi:transcriptional regulator GlxA family with amidase domain
VDIAIPLFERLTALDAVGPYDVLTRLPGATVRLVAVQPGPHHTEDGGLGLVADTPLDDLPAPDVVVVPGGVGEAAVRGEHPLLSWLRAADRSTTWTTSVCTGSLILGAAGLLRGRRATSHWTALGELGAFGAVATDERVVVDGKYVTAAGVSSGIDMALWLAAQLADRATAEAIQLAIEYDPQPPFTTGSTSTAPPELVELVRGLSRFPSAT